MITRAQFLELARLVWGDVTAAVPHLSDVGVIALAALSGRDPRAVLLARRYPGRDAP